jgi:hypothetical protein
MDCSVLDCNRPHRSKNQPMCEMHYYRVRRTGRTGSAEPRQLVSDAACAIDGCDRRSGSLLGWCGTHYTRFKRHGSPDIVRKAAPTPKASHPQWKAEHIGYSAAHMRVRAAQGSASAYPCVDCQGEAQQWSYDHADQNEKQSDFGAYSTDPQHYEARCTSCHKLFDLAHI